MDTSIIIVNFNGEAFISDCLQSIFDQKKEVINKLEIILVDNGSTDSSVRLIKDKFNAVKLIEVGSNIGFASGCNKGFEVATGNIIVFLNPDTKFSNNLFDTMYAEKIMRNLDVIAAREKKYYSNEMYEYSSQADIIGNSLNVMSDSLSQSKESFYLTAACIMFDRKFYMQTGGLDASFFMYYEDLDWFWRLRLFDSSFGYSNSAFVHHLGQGSRKTIGQLDPQFYFWRAQNQPKVLIKNYGLLFLFVAMFLYYSVFLVEIIIFFICGKRKVTSQMLKGNANFLKNFRKTWQSRSIVQSRRVIRDIDIVKLLLPGLAMFYNKRNKISALLRRD